MTNRAPKARRVAALGVAGELAQRLQDLGDALDATVQACKTGDALADGLARRLHELWVEEDYVLDWQATEIRSGGRLVLAAGAQHGAFVLVAHSAGLRVLAIRRDSVPADAMRLCRRLSALQASAIHPREFADWLWRGGALGFDLAQAEAATHAGDGLVLPTNDREHWKERSLHAVKRWKDLAQAAAVLPPVALRDRFEGPLARLKERAVQGQLSLNEGEIEVLRLGADDALAFAQAEVALLLRQEGLRKILPTTEIGLRLGTIVEGVEQVDKRIFDLFAAFARGGHAVDRGVLGQALARRVLLGRMQGAAFLELVDPKDTELLRGFFPTLVTHSEGDGGTGLELLLMLLRDWGVGRFFSHVEPSQLGPRLATSLIGQALRLGPDAKTLIAVLDRLSVEAALHALMAAPELLSVAQGLFQNLIAQHPQSSSPLLVPLIQSSPAVARTVGAALKSKLCEGFAEEALRSALSALALAEMGDLFVLPIWEARSAGSGARLCALFALSNHPDLLREAHRRRPNAYGEPKEIREALEELRWKDLP